MDSDKERSIISRRKVLKRLGAVAGISSMPVSASTVGSASSSGQSNTTGNHTETDGQMSSGEENISPQAMTSTDATFSPNNISAGETTTLTGKWNFQSVIPANNYQLDIIVQDYAVSAPETMSINIPTKKVTKDWVADHDDSLGGVYHWQAKNVWVVDIFGDQAVVRAEATPVASTRGKLKAKVGTYWPAQMWATAYLDI